MNSIWNRTNKFVLPIVAAALLNCSTTAFALTLKETLNVFAMVDSASWTTESIRRNGFLSDSANLELQGEYNEAGFTSTMSGTSEDQPIELVHSGSLTGDFGEDILINITLTGYVGTNDVNGNSTFTWLFDSEAGGYSSAEYTQEGEVNPAWFLIAAAIAVFLITATPLNQNETQTQGTYNGQSGTPATQSNTTVNNGGVTSQMNGATTFTGNFGGGMVGGQASPIPEPTTWATLLLGLGLLVALNRRRR